MHRVPWLLGGPVLGCESTDGGPVLPSLWPATFPSLLPRAQDEWPDATGCHSTKIVCVLCRHILPLFGMGMETPRKAAHSKRFRNLQKTGVAWRNMPSTWETGADLCEFKVRLICTALGQPGLHGETPVSKKC